MSVEPNSLAEVPEFYTWQLHAAELAHNTSLRHHFDAPQDADNLIDVLSARQAGIHDTMTSSSTNIAMIAKHTRDAVIWLGGDTVRHTLQQAEAAPTIQEAKAIAEYAGDETDAIHIGLDMRVLQEAQAALSVVRGHDVIDWYASPSGRTVLKAALDARVHFAVLSTKKLDHTPLIASYASNPVAAFAIQASAEGRILDKAIDADTLDEALELITLAVSPTRSQIAIAALGPWRAEYSDKLDACNNDIYRMERDIDALHKQGVKASSIAGKKGYATKRRKARDTHELALLRIEQAMYAA